MRLARPPTAGQSHRPRFWFLLLLVSSVTAFLLPHSNQLLGVHQPAQCREKPRLSQQCRAPVVMMGRGNDRDRGGKGGDQSVRQLRVARMLQSTLADVIRKGYPIKTADVLDDHIRSKISVVEVNCSPDFSSARVEVSIFGETVEKREAFIWLVNNAKAIRYALAQELKDFRHTPQLIFRQVDLGAGSDMFSLLDKLEEQRSMRGEVGGDDQGYDSEAEGEYSSDEGEYESDEEGDYTSDEEDDELYSSDEDEVFSDDENLTSDDEDDVIWEEDEEEGGDQAGEVVSLAGAGRKQGVFPPKVNIGGAGLSSSRPAWSRVGEAYVPGALEAELAAEFAALASGEGEDDEDMWGDEDDDEEFVIGDDEEGDEEEDENDEEEEMRWEEDDEVMDEEELRGWMLEQIKLRQERLAGLGPIPEGIVSRMEAAEELWEEDDDEEEEEEEVPTPRLKVKTSKKEQRAFQAKRKQARAMDEEEDIDMLQREGWIDMDKIMAEVDEDEDEEDEDDFEDDDDFEDEDEYEGGENWFMEAAADKDGWVDMDKILDEAEGEEDLDELLVRMGGDSFFMDGDGKEEKPAAKENKQQKGKGKQGAAAAGATKAASPIPPPPKTGGGSKKQQQGGEKGKKSPKNKRSKWFYGNQK